jgi:hypothetical protein
VFARFLEPVEFNLFVDKARQGGAGDLLRAERPAVTFSRAEVPLPVHREYPLNGSRFFLRDLLVYAWLAFGLSAVPFDQNPMHNVGRALYFAV